MKQPGLQYALGADWSQGNRFLYQRCLGFGVGFGEVIFVCLFICFSDSLEEN